MHPLQKTNPNPRPISSLRLAAIPLFIYLYNMGMWRHVWFCLLFAAATDLLDGYFARKLNATTKFGAYYDATTDFALVIGIYSLFLLPLASIQFGCSLLIAASFTQFLVTSRYAKKLYDPIGRYIGSALYIGIVLTLVFPVKAIFIFVQYAFVGFLLISLASRIISLAKKPMLRNFKLIYRFSLFIHQLVKPLPRDNMPNRSWFTRANSSFIRHRHCPRAFKRQIGCCANNGLFDDLQSGQVHG